MLLPPGIMGPGRALTCDVGTGKANRDHTGVATVTREPHSAQQPGKTKVPALRVTLCYPVGQLTPLAHTNRVRRCTLCSCGKTEAGPGPLSSTAPWPGRIGCETFRIWSCILTPRLGGSGLQNFYRALSDVSLVPQITSSQGHFRRGLTSGSLMGTPRAGTGQPPYRSLCRLPRTALATPRRCSSRLAGVGQRFLFPEPICRCVYACVCVCMWCAPAWLPRLCPAEMWE